MQDVQDPVTGALDRLAAKIDSLAADADADRSRIITTLSAEIRRVRDGVSALEDRVAVLELLARSSEVVQAACRPEPIVPQPAPPRLVEALHGPSRRAPVAVPLDIPGRGAVVAHIDPDPDVDPDETMGGIVRALHRPGA